MKTKTYTSLMLIFITVLTVSAWMLGFESGDSKTQEQCKKCEEAEIDKILKKAELRKGYGADMEFFLEEDNSPIATIATVRELRKPYTVEIDPKALTNTIEITIPAYREGVLVFVATNNLSK